MKLIMLSDSGRESLTLNTQNWRVKLLFGTTVVALLILGAFGFRLTGQAVQMKAEADMLNAWQAQLAEEKQLLEQTREQVDLELSALTAKVATLQARIMRLDALGERMAEMADLDGGEFDFSRQPAFGGPEITYPDSATDDNSTAVSEASSATEINRLLNQLEDLVQDRENQLSVLDRQLLAREFKSAAFVAGRPIKRGWMSSAFGHRTDPFTGKKAWHNGVDFAGKAGDDVMAIAGGVVTFSGKRYGYGQMVEINHGNGFVTRYAHNKSNLVAVGDIVEKNQAIAEMGSTGRSTGPHVHFEVLRNGKPIDPERYIYRASL